MRKITLFLFFSLFLLLSVEAGTSPENDIVIDVHSHFTTEEYLALLKKHNAEMDELYPIPAWNEADLQKFMDKSGISLSILTTPAPQPYFGDADEAAKVCRSINDSAAAIAKRAQGRVAWCATLPLPDAAKSIDEVKRAVKLGASCVKMPTNARGVYLADKSLEPLMKVLNELGTVVILHPHRPEPFNKKLADGLPLAMYEYTAETTRAVALLFAHNVPARYPKVRFVVPHAGALLPLALPRMKAVHPVVMAAGYAGKIDWDANLKSFWFDVAGSPNAESVKRLIKIVPPEKILYGSDFPYVPANALSAGLSKFKEELSQDPELSRYKNAVLYENAAKLFGLKNFKSVKTEQTMQKNEEKSGLIVRIAEIEVHPQWLESYLAAAKTVGAESVAKEAGVVCIFPMQMKEKPNFIRIVEIYRNDAAYKAHLNTPHFKTYKEGTLHMVKSLELVPMSPLDIEHMGMIFKKEKQK